MHAESLKLIVSSARKRCPHLLKTIVETGFENRAGNSGESGLRSEIDTKPTLICETLVAPQRLRLFGAEADPASGPENSIYQVFVSVGAIALFRFASAPRLIKYYFSVQDSIVPSIADRHSSRPSGRSLTIFCNSAYTLTGCQPNRTEYGSCAYRDLPLLQFLHRFSPGVSS